MNSVGIVSFRDVSFFQVNVGFRDFSPIHNRCSRDEILYCESLDFKRFSFVLRGWEINLNELLQMIRESWCFEPTFDVQNLFFLRNPRQRLQVWPRIHCDDNSSFFFLIDLLFFLERSSKNFLSCSSRLGGSSPFGGGLIGPLSSVLVAEFLLLTQLTTVWCVFLKRLQIRLRVLSSLSSCDERLWL